MRPDLAIYTIILLLFASALSGQQAPPVLSADSGLREGLEPVNAAHCGDLSNYVLGPDDQITVMIPELDELNGKAFRLDKDGELQLPLAGRLNGAGLTAEQLGHAIEKHLTKFVNQPQAIVSVTEFRSQPVSVLGQVGNPGVYQIQGCKTLFEVLSLAGGLKPDAGDRVRITRDLRRGRIPLPQAQNDASGRFSLTSVSIKDIMDARHPEENIAIMPTDVISVPKAELVYVVGAVHKPGGFVLGEEGSISVLQVISLAEGPEKTAATKRAKIMRPIPGTTERSEVPIDLSKLMAGKSDEDPRLHANDILFVPDSAGKSFGAKTLDAAITALTGAAVFRPF
jgi:polysaccharide export outer membrane protein